MAAALFAAYWLLCGLLPRHHLVWLLLVLAVQQAYLIARLGVRLLFFASQTGLYLTLTRPPAPPEEPPPAAPPPPAAAASPPQNGD